MPDLLSIASVHSILGHEPSKVQTRPSEDVSRPKREDIDAAATVATTVVNDDDDDTPDKVDQQHHPPASSSSGGPTVKTISKLSPFGALISRTLPQYKGNYPVGVFDIELPVREARSIGSFRHKELHSIEPGFQLDTVLFSVFYPTEEPTVQSTKVVWFPNLRQTVNGFLKMARRTSWIYKAIAYPIAAAAIYGTTFPALNEAPLRKPEKANEQWPLAIFSHGVGCSRLMYSSICGELASRGYVVCAVEHRDGTGPSCSIRLDNGTVKDLNFLNWQDLIWPNLPQDEQPKDDTTLRHDQLELRCAEIEEIIDIMRRINHGDPVIQESIKSPNFDWERWGPAWNAINTNKPVMLGHSLGGSAALLAAGDPERFRFRSVVAMDPACQRIEPWESSISSPLLVINSEEFTLSHEYERLQKVAKTAQNPPIYSIAGSTHPSFSDVFLIVPSIINRWVGLACDADEVLDNTMDITLAFLRHSHQPMRTKTQMIKEWEGPLSAPMGDPGTIHWHPVDDTFSASYRTHTGDSNARISKNDAGQEEEDAEAEAEAEDNSDEIFRRVGSIDEDRERPLGRHISLVLHDTDKAARIRDELVRD